MFKIKVPATTANLGPGFDCIGLALDLYNEFSFDSSNSFQLVNFLEQFNNDENLVLKAYKQTFAFVKQDPIPVTISIKQAIPNCGGLGSSCTCVVAGVIGANHFLKDKLSQDEVLAIMTSIEGHPDNIAPACFGGLVSSIIINNKIMTIKYPVNPLYRFTILIPKTSLDTLVARLVLPHDISMHDAVFNLSRAINLPYALNNEDETLLFEIMQDCLHQPYRLPLIAGAKDIMTQCYQKKIPCVLSGAGASLLAISKEPLTIDLKNWQALELKVCQKGVI